MQNGTGYYICLLAVPGEWRRAIDGKCWSREMGIGERERRVYREGSQPMSFDLVLKFILKFCRRMERERAFLAEGITCAKALRDVTEH